MADERQKSQNLRQYLAAASACLGIFSMGCAVGWYSPASVIFKEKESTSFTPEQLSWISAIMPLCVAVGMPLFGPLVMLIGNKTAMLLATPLMTCSWLLLFVENYYAILLSRSLTGFAGAIYSVAAPLFIGEMSEVQIRGRLGIFYQVMLCGGVLFAFIFGIFENMYILTLSCSAVCLLSLTLLFCKETPVFHLRKGDEEAAASSLKFYRGKDYQPDGELKKLREYLENMRSGESMWTLIKQKQSLRALRICTGCHLIQQLSGIKAVVFYTHPIFSIAASNLSPHVSSLIVMITLLLTTFVSAYLVEIAGRKMLLIISCTSMTICHLVLGLFFTVHERDPDLAAKFNFVPLIFCCAYIFCYSLGAGPVSWALQAEMFPAKVKFIVGSMAACTNWFAAFLVTKFFPTISVHLGIQYTFYIFSGLSLAGLLFTLVYVFETKGKTLDEIQEELAK